MGMFWHIDCDYKNCDFSEINKDNNLCGSQRVAWAGLLRVVGGIQVMGGGWVWYDGWFGLG